MQLVSGFYGGKEHYSGSSNPAKVPAKNGERNCAPPLLSKFSLFPVFSCDEPPSDGWQATTEVRCHGWSRHDARTGQTYRGGWANRRRCTHVGGRGD
jgi:hypothetical protein